MKRARLWKRLGQENLFHDRQPQILFPEQTIREMVCVLAELLLAVARIHVSTETNGGDDESQS